MAEKPEEAVSTWGNIQPFRRRRRRFPIPESASSALGVLGFTVPDGSVTFRLRRVRKGTEIFFKCGQFRWNVSEMLGIWPSSFKSARTWVDSYACGHGQTVTEERR